MNKAPAPITVRSGRFVFRKVNATRWDPRDVYHWLLTLPWWAFSAVLGGLYLLVNVIFAGLYVLGGPCVAELPAGSFGGAFFFSVETLATVGYGHMYPDTTYGHVVTTAEIMVGMFGLAVVTGLIFVRFSRPTARIAFSRVMVVSTFDGQPTLMLRAANLRHQAMVEAEFRLMVIRNELIAEGEVVRRFHPLRLHFDRLITFPAALTLRHTLDAGSPLHGATPATLEAADCRLVVSIVCVDTVVPASVQSAQDYAWHEVRFDERFVEIYTEDEGGALTVDYGRLHETEPVPAALALAPGTAGAGSPGS